MDNYFASTYGDSIADQYDSLSPPLDPDLIDRLCELSGGGKVLELGIGTGRIALPLSQRGVEIHGIDASPAMLEKLKGKDTKGAITAKKGSFAEFESVEKYDLIFVVYNTIFALLTQKEQISCFKSVAEALKPNGKFLIEAFIPDLARFDRGQTIRTIGISTEQVKLECSHHDIATQTVASQLITIDNGQGINFYPVSIRYAWPSELDLLAKLAGLKFFERWGGWNKQGFTSSSAFHVSIYEK